jgi:cytochrome bd ubiquinol oxidase subunit II
VCVFLFGLVAGNAMEGLPLGADHEVHVSLTELLGPYALSVGVFAVAACAMHGAIYLHLKTEGDLQERTRAWMWRTFFVFLAAYLLVTVMTFFAAPHALTNFERWPAAWIIVVLNALSIANIPRAIHQRRPAYAFVSSSCTIAALVFLFGMALFPNLVVSSTNEAWDLTIYNACSTDHTLGLLTIIAALGAPLVLTYTAIVYWVFRGKVKLGDTSY